jgi:hypothetical protein
VALSVPAHGETENALFKQQSTWILDTCHELWHFFQRWTTGSSTHALHDEVIASYLQLIVTFTIPRPGGREHSVHLRKAISLSIDSVTHLVESLAASPMSESCQTQLALLLTRLCHFAQPDALNTPRPHQQRGIPKTFDTEMLRESIRVNCGKLEVLSGLQEDLQVWPRRD